MQKLRMRLQGDKIITDDRFTLAFGTKYPAPGNQPSDVQDNLPYLKMECSRWYSSIAWVCDDVPDMPMLERMQPLWTLPGGIINEENAPAVDKAIRGFFDRIAHYACSIVRTRSLAFEITGYFLLAFIDICEILTPYIKTPIPARLWMSSASSKVDIFSYIYHTTINDRDLSWTKKTADQELKKARALCLQTDEAE